MPPSSLKLPAPAPALRAALTVDGTGVTALTVLALASALKGKGWSGNARSLVAIAGVGIAGFALAVTAVRLALDRAREVDRHRLRSAQLLIATGFVVNSVGCSALIAISSNNKAAVRTATGLLVAGNVLSGIYALEIDKLAPSKSSQQRRLP
jgi:hypothetical protein